MKSTWMQILLSLAIGFSLGITFDKFIPSNGKCTSCAPFERSCKDGCCKDKPCCKAAGDWHHCKGKKIKEKMLNHFSSELNLTNDQKSKVAAIFDSKHKEMMRIREELHPKFETLRKSTHDEINKILTSEQQKKFIKMEEKFESHRKKKHLER